MKRVLFLLSLPCLFFISCFAQENLPCPNITVVTLKQINEPGEPIPFSIFQSKELKDLDLEYKWKLSYGVIEEGQGTSSISVGTAGLENTGVSATVEIKGLPQNCPNTFTGTAIVANKPSVRFSDPPAIQFENDIKGRIRNFYYALGYAPTTSGVIINYGTKKELAKREAEIRKAVRLGKYDINRIEFIRAIRKQKIRSQFFIVPQGAKSPVPEP